MVEVAYVGNRGAYFPAPNMDQIAANTVTPASLKSQWGFLILLIPRMRLLSLRLPSAARPFSASFPQFRTLTSVNRYRSRVPSVYKGFPASQNLIQAIRGVPQWAFLGPWIGPPMRQDLVSDSMQAKVTKRYLGHGFQASGNFYSGPRAWLSDRLRTAPTSWAAKPPPRTSTTLGSTNN